MSDFHSRSHALGDNPINANKVDSRGNGAMGREGRIQFVLYAFYGSSDALLAQPKQAHNKKGKERKGKKRKRNRK